MSVLASSERVCVEVWDDSSQPMAHACVLIFDVTRKETYKNLVVWYKELSCVWRGGMILLSLFLYIDNPVLFGGTRRSPSRPDKGRAVNVQLKD